MEAAGSLHCSLAEITRDWNRQPTTRVDVVQLARLNCDSAHFLKRHRLSAELDAIGLQTLTARSLRLDWLNPFLSCDTVSLDSVRPAHKAEALGSQPDIGLNSNAFPHTTAGSRDGLVQEAPFTCEHVLFEDSVDMDQRRLPFAKREVLDS